MRRRASCFYNSAETERFLGLLQSIWFSNYKESVSRCRVAPILQKFLAQKTLKSQTLCTMSTFARSNNQGRVSVTICVFAAFLWALALSASPQLHQRVHKDANRGEHNCAVTMIASGSCNHAAHPPLISAPAPAPQFSEIPALTPCWVQSPFLGACIFEHAPPFRA